MNSDKEQEFLSYAKKLGERRRHLLKAFLATDVTLVNTADLRDATSGVVPKDSVLHHLERLDSGGLVEEQERREYHGRGGRNARTWKLTERGLDFCEEYVDAPLHAFVSPEEVAALEQRVESLEDNLKDVKGIMLRLGVHTDMLSKDQVRERIDEEWYQEVFDR